MSDLVGNPEDRFSHDEAHFVCRFQGIVYIDKDVVGWRPIAKSWLESRTPQEIHVSSAEFRYRKVPKFWDSRNFCCNLPKIQAKRPNLKGILSKWCKWNSKQ